MTSADYIEWATTWAPTPTTERASLQHAIAVYDEVDDTLGDSAENDDFLTRVLWLETAIRLARIGWTIAELEDRRWPVHNSADIVVAARQG